jgi:hypothetical protein
MMLKLGRIAVVSTAVLALAVATIPTKAEAFGFLVPAIIGSAIIGAGSGAWGGGGACCGYGGGGYAYGGYGCCVQVPPPPPCCYYGGGWGGGRGYYGGGYYRDGYGGYGY